MLWVGILLLLVAGWNYVVFRTEIEGYVCITLILIGYNTAHTKASTATVAARKVCQAY